MQTKIINKTKPNDSIYNTISKLSSNQQILVIEYIKKITQKPHKVNFNRYVGVIDKDDIKLMKESIFADCEKIDYNEW